MTTADLRRHLPHAVATVLFLAAFANIVRGVGYVGNEYRSWAFEHHSYSDGIAMSTDRYATGARPLPYVEDAIEYPVLLGYVGLWLPSFAPGGSLGRIIVTALILLGCLWITLSMLQRIPGANVWWIGGFIPLFDYVLLNFDFLALSLLSVAVYFYARERPRDSALAAAAGTWTKLFPVVTVPAAIADLLRMREYRKLVTSAGWFLAVSVVVNVPFMMLNFKNWSHFFRFNIRRPGEGIWYMMGFSDWKVANTVTFVMLLAAVLYAAICVYRSAVIEAPAAERTRPYRSGLAFILCAWILTSKAQQPQYVLYIAMAAAITSAPLFLMIPLTLVGVAEYHIAWDCLTADPAKKIGLCQYLGASHVARASSFLFVVIWLGMELWRGMRAATPRTRPAQTTSPASE
jgi:hypothetical protein